MLNRNHSYWDKCNMVRATEGGKALQVVVESPNIILASILFIKLGECGCGQQHLTYFIILL